MTTTTPATNHTNLVRLWCDLQRVHPCSDGVDSRRMTNMPARFITDAAEPYESNATDWRAYGRHYFTRTTA